MLDRKKVKLGELKKDARALVVCLEKSTGPMELVQRLMEMGFLEGTRIEVVHEAPFGGDPFVIRVRGSLIALRRQEANLIEVYIDE